MLDNMINYMKEFVANVDSQMAEVEAEMSKLDENAKDYIELDFEYNWLNGQRMASNHLLQHAEKMKEGQ